MTCRFSHILFPCVFPFSAPPSPPEIHLKVSTRSQEDVTLTCLTSGYYPPEVAVSWQSSDIDLPAPGPLEIWKSEDGDFRASRLLVLPSRLLTVSCIVHHISLAAPVSTNYSHDFSTFGSIGYELVGYLNILKIALILGLTVAILLTVQKRCKHK
ncbi:H-2 class I histocompatibility antigen, K-D alpha chain-like [Engystomops pustulosus]|uniref:H-2 class I histocompatibility antigen, K-D alpha chain-like n=1 Tax=Engystomops pustulosus TaxID=76066 RepID=UPI003AFB212B